MRLTYVTVLITFLLLQQCKLAKIVLEEGIPPAQCARPAVIVCDTDTDCMRKNGGDGSPSARL